MHIYKLADTSSGKLKFGGSRPADKRLFDAAANGADSIMHIASLYPES